MQVMQQIQNVLETYLEARVAGDADLWLSIWDDDGIQLFPGQRAINLKELRKTTHSRFTAIPVNSAEIYTDDITVIEGYAIAHGHFLLERLVNGESVNFDGKFLTILKQQSDGTWKIFRDCSNSNE